jgi:UDPglucose--hexose-1-phosphate uridylyltransferase
VSELRKDPVIGRWVIISTERAKRPSDLKLEPDRPRGGFCPLCPGNEDKTPPEVFSIPDERTGGRAWAVRVVPNKFPALSIEGGLHKRSEGMYDIMNGVGAHEVIIETPDHAATYSSMPAAAITTILLTIKSRLTALRQDSRLRYIAVFKNCGEAAGATLEHPHSQLIALPVIPRRLLEKLDGAQAYFNYKRRCVFCDIIGQETADGRRMVAGNEHCVAFEPFAPRFPFETHILPRAHLAAFEDTPGHVMSALADIMSVVFKKLNAALGFPPFNFMLHTAPFNKDVGSFYHWHLEIIPRLTKVAGFEWGSGFYINPTPPEQAAQYLRDTADGR